MKKYLSFGGGVNSTAMLLLLHDEGEEFETIFVDHGCDWPETYEYVKILREKYPITVLKPDVQGFDNLYDYCISVSKIPTRMFRWCTDKFKIRPVSKYVEKPCFMLIGYASDESKRVSLNSSSQIENRFPLIEYEIDREACIQIIKDHGLPIPHKSGCWFCPFQPLSEFKRLRREHPDLFCKVEALDNCTHLHLYRDVPIRSAINEDSKFLFSEMEYPPCQCGL